MHRLLLATPLLRIRGLAAQSRPMGCWDKHVLAGSACATRVRAGRRPRGEWHGSDQDPRRAGRAQHTGAAPEPAPSHQSRSGRTRRSAFAPRTPYLDVSRGWNDDIGREVRRGYSHSALMTFENEIGRRSFLRACAGRALSAALARATRLPLGGSLRRFGVLGAFLGGHLPDDERTVIDLAVEVALPFLLALLLAFLGCRHVCLSSPLQTIRPQARTGARSSFDAR